ncbi:hypothetical protein EYF80_010218 [Liparis tanakae]|uniref:Uncharacterized protein n=1 Tax=Liparis tanakae TaxID=230148 RepID=A0A4Z2IP46_9TELE|nr:hypothetical protein EYF80_010218 [Liparis tanakae]
MERPEGSRGPSSPSFIPLKEGQEPRARITTKENNLEGPHAATIGVRADMRATWESAIDFHFNNLTSDPRKGGRDVPRLATRSQMDSLSVMKSGPPDVEAATGFTLLCHLGILRWSICKFKIPTDYGD